MMPDVNSNTKKRDPKNYRNPKRTGEDLAKKEKNESMLCLVDASYDLRF